MSCSFIASLYLFIVFCFFMPPFLVGKLACVSGTGNWSFPCLVWQESDRTLTEPSVRSVLSVLEELCRELFTSFVMCLIWRTLLRFESRSANKQWTLIYSQLMQEPGDRYAEEKFVRVIQSRPFADLICQTCMQLTAWHIRPIARQEQREPTIDLTDEENLRVEGNAFASDSAIKETQWFLSFTVYLCDFVCIFLYFSFFVHLTGVGGPTLWPVCDGGAANHL